MSYVSLENASKCPVCNIGFPVFEEEGDWSEEPHLSCNNAECQFHIIDVRTKDGTRALAQWTYLSTQRRYDILEDIKQICFSNLTDSNKISIIRKIYNK